MAGYGQNMMDIRKQSSDLWTQMLKQAQGLQSGQTNPWELPEFKQYQNQYMDWMDKFMKNLYSQASARNMNPGAAMEQLKAQIPAQLGTAMQNFVTQAYQRVPQYAQGGMDQWNKFAQLWLQKQHQDMQEQVMQNANTKGWVNSGVGALTGLLGGLGGIGGNSQPNIDWSQAYGMNNSQAPTTWGYT